MQTMSIPARLEQKINAFKDTATIFNEQNDIFRDASWLQVMAGQGIMPRDHHPAANTQTVPQLLDVMGKVLQAKQQPLTQMLPHDEFLKRFTQ